MRGGAGNGNERQRERKGTTGGRQENGGQEKGGEFGKELKWGVFRVVKMHYWQPYRLAPLKMSCPPLASPLKKAGAATALKCYNLATM